MAKGATRRTTLPDRWRRRASRGRALYKHVRRQARAVLESSGDKRSASRPDDGDSSRKDRCGRRFAGCFDREMVSECPAAMGVSWVTRPTRSFPGDAEVGRNVVASAMGGKEQALTEGGGDWKGFRQASSPLAEGGFEQTRTLSCMGALQGLHDGARRCRPRPPAATSSRSPSA